MEDNIKIILGVFIFIGIVILNISYNRIMWNNGICKECGSPMGLTTVYSTSYYSKNGGSSTSHYVYSCENCHHNVNLTIDPNGMFGMIY